MRAQQQARGGGLGVAVGDRAAWADNLRVALIAGVIVAHVATAYVVDVSWYYEERTTSVVTPLVLSFPVFLAALFGLGPLFLVAGAFSAQSLRRKGPASFVRGRLIRLGMPLLFFVLVLDPLTDFLGDLGSGLQGSVWDYLTNSTGTSDFGPMWFVVALLVFSVLYAAWRHLRPRDLVAGQVIASWQLIAFAVAIAVTSWALWLEWTYRSETFFNFNWAHWPQGAGLFILGVMAGERGWLVTFDRSRARRCGWVAAMGMLVLSGLAGWSLANDDFESLVGGPNVPSAAFAAVTGTVAVALAMWITAWFARRWNDAGPTARRAARGSYAAYVVHPTVLVTLSLAAMELPVEPEAKLVLVAAFGVPAVFTVGYGLTRLPVVQRFV